MTDPLTPPAGDGGVSGELRHDTAVGGRRLVAWPTRPGRAAAGTALRVAQRVGAHRALALILAVGVVAIFLLAFLAARVYDAVTERDGVAGLDVPLLHAAASLRSPVTDGVAGAVAYGFGPIGLPILAHVAIAVLSLRRRAWTPAILVVAAGLGSLAMTIAGKDIIDRHRPPLADAIPPFEYSPSFPSGHTLNATVVVGVVAYLILLRRRTVAARVVAVVVAVGIPLLVGLTRILLGAHWFTDVLAGWLLGALWLAIVITAHRLYLTARVRGAPA
ncbi:MAG: phosphatase PAP2 family protein [Amnibacterium sp.]